METPILIGQGDGSQSIADIVDTRNVQHKMTEQGISFIAVKVTDVRIRQT